MERETHHTVRLLGPYGRDDDAQTEATHMAKIQTQAWAHWLESLGVSREVIESSLWSDVSQNDHMQAREARLREAFGRTNQNEMVLYFGAYATSGDMVGFAKFLISSEPHPETQLSRMLFLLAEIDVLPEYQGSEQRHRDDQLLAKKMMYSAIAQVSDPNAILRLKVLQSNERAIALYQSLGLRECHVGEFDFEDDSGTVVHQEPHITMEGSVHEAREILYQKIMG